MRSMLLFMFVTSLPLGADEGPPPPPLLEDRIDEGSAPPQQLPPATKPTPTTMSTTTPMQTTTTDPRPVTLPPPLRSGAVVGAVTGGVAAGIGATAGAVLLLVTEVQAFLPDIFFIGMVLSSSSLASLMAGLVVVALVVPHPGFDEFAGVAACSAIGGAATWLLLAGGAGGGAGCDPGGCARSVNCAHTGASSRSDSNSSRGIPAAAGGGLGALGGLGLGALLVYLNDENAAAQSYRVGAAVGLMAGAVVGGAIGGAIVGFAVGE